MTLDTSADAAAVVRAAILRMPAAERVRQALVHSEAMRELALQRLRERYPDKTTLELVELLLGEKLGMPGAEVRQR